VAEAMSATWAGGHGVPSARSASAHPLKGVLAGQLTTASQDLAGEPGQATGDAAGCALSSGQQEVSSNGVIFPAPLGSAEIKSIREMAQA
jgi:hypothetical protein